MRIEQFDVVLRKRKPWEAIDLGFLIFQRWRKPALLSWLATYWVAVAILTVCLWSHPWIWLAVVWWMKPAFERILLFVFSRAVFGSTPNLLLSLKAFPGLLWRTQLWADLSFRRFTPSRSFLLPVLQLEGQRGATRRLRQKVLRRNQDGYATWMSFCCLCFVFSVSAAVMAFIQLIVPDDLKPFGTEVFWFGGAFTLRMGQLSYVIAESLIEPVYVAAGFALYLNRRSDLEAWDIELAFRRMTRRIEEAAAPVAAAAMILATTVVIALGAAGSSTLARAEDRPSASSDGAAQSAQVNPIGPQSVPFAAVGAVGAAGATAPSLPVKPIEGIDRAKATIVSVKSDPVFGSTSERHWWQYRPPMTHPDLNASWLTRFFQLFAPIIENIVEFFASAGRALLYVAAAILIVLVIVLVVLYSGGWASWKGRRSKAAPEMMFGLDVRPESLPDDVVAAAREALARGDFARALSLLYRGALVALIHRMHVEFRAGDTEENCATRIERVIDVPRFAYFRMLLDARLAIVYGHRVLPLGQLEALCDRWTENFGARTENAGTVR